MWQDSSMAQSLWYKTLQSTGTMSWSYHTAGLPSNEELLVWFLDCTQDLDHILGTYQNLCCSLKNPVESVFLVISYQLLHSMFTAVRLSSVSDTKVVTRWPECVTGLQLRKSERNGFHDNFLISQPNPMIRPSLKLSLRDDSNECDIIGFGREIRKLAFWKLSILDLICCPEFLIYNSMLKPFCAKVYWCGCKLALLGANKCANLGLHCKGTRSVILALKVFNLCQLHIYW